MHRQQFGITVLGGEVVRTLDRFLRFYGEFVPTDGHGLIPLVFIVSAKRRIDAIGGDGSTEVLRFAQADKSLFDAETLLPKQSGRRSLLPPPVATESSFARPDSRGGCPYVFPAGLRGFARALGLDVLLAAHVDFDLFGFGFGLLC